MLRILLIPEISTRIVSAGVLLAGALGPTHLEVIGRGVLGLWAGLLALNATLRVKKRYELIRIARDFSGVS